MNRDVLCRPFPAEVIRQRPGQKGKTLSYVETHEYIRRLNDGLESWSFEIVRHELLADEVIVVGKLTADGIVKMAFGGAAITKSDTGNELSLADDLKAAASDALKKSASLLGVGLELYGGGTTSVSGASNTETIAGRPRSTGRAVEPDARLTSRQLSAIVSITRRRRMHNDDITRLLQERFSKDALQDLSKREASQLLDEFNAPLQGAAA